ncbi:MAG: thermonuclease family protein [Acidobacteria bacterium]|nr:thermonuclease family protein [Acidobacteriota bacterium]
MSKLYTLILLLFVFPSLAYGAEFKIVIRVVSGDTIIVDGGQAVRLIGVLAPQNEEAAEEAKKFLEKQLLAEEVDLYNDNINNAVAHKDQYGRRLAYVYRTSDNLFVNKDLIRRGLCFYSSLNLQKHTTTFLLDQQDARKMKLGIWQDVAFSPQEEADTLKLPYKEPAFEFKPKYKTPDLRVEILWAKKADPKVKIVRSEPEAKFLGSLYSDPDLGNGKVPLLVQVRKNFAVESTKYYQEQNIKLTIETEGDLAETLKFTAEGMDQKDADSFCAVPLNRELFAGLEFKQIIFTDGGQFSYTYKIE